MNRRTDITFPVFSGQIVRVILAANVKTTGQRLQSDLSAARGGFIANAGQSVAGWLPNVVGWLVLESEPDAATVAHEASHAVRALFRASGVRVDEEVFAYHLDFLVGRIHRFMKGKPDATL